MECLRACMGQFFLHGAVGMFAQQQQEPCGAQCHGSSHWPSRLHAAWSTHSSE